MSKFGFVGVSMLALATASPVWAQDTGGNAPSGTAQSAEPDTQESYGEDIVVTAQRQSQRLQDVPIAVSAFSAEALESQQIENASDLQLTLPNVTFTKTNFTASSFTIRGIGDLCTGVTCDAATGIHLNDSPLFGTRLFETEYFDVERVEVLRGPQGTLFGRNATAGVVNLVTAKPDLSSFGAAGDAEYGNFDSIKVKGMLNLPIGEMLGVRVAGYYLNRDGYTHNIFDDSQIDGRDLYSVRGSIRFEPGINTTIDLMASYFHEDDNRLRIQKQLCQRDPTAVLGCLPGRLENGVTNGNASFVGTLSSREFLTSQGIPGAFGLGSLYGPDAYTGVVNPADLRTVNTDFNPTYFTDELIFQGKLNQRFGKMNLSLSGTYQEVEVDSSQDYNLSVQNRALLAPGLNVLAAAAAGGIPGLPASYFAPIAAALIPDGPNGRLCVSLPEETGTGSFGGNNLCAMTPLDFDRSNSTSSAWSGEAILSSEFDGPFNFLLGGIYSESRLTENSYYVNAFGIDYISGVLGSFTALSRGLPPSYLATPFFRNNTDDFKLTSYGLFGEAYLEINDRLKLTAGIRYNNDEKSVRARSTLASFLAPYSSTNAFDSPFFGAFDADPGTAGIQGIQERSTSTGEFTGRAVIDWKVTDDNLVYASYSRGYKSGGINPPLQPIFAVPESFAPEFVNAFEIGSKNQFGNGALTLNITGFYYQYNDLQLARIVARTAVNDNVDADIYGVEAEAIIRPSRELQINLGASYLHTKVTSDKFLSNPRDPSGGRGDAVIIKDITNGSNCAVTPNVPGGQAASSAFVTGVNNAINAGLIPGLQPGAGLRGPAAFPSDSGLGTATGAFSVCAALQALAGTNFTVHPSGVEVNLRGNELPQAPMYKFSAGVQYTAELGDMKLVPRFDLAYTGESYGSIFNGNIDRIEGFVQMNAQIQLSGPDDRWYVRGFIQNIANSDSITGQYVTDASSGLYTNVFTLDPRRYGAGVGFKF